MGHFGFGLSSSTEKLPWFEIRCLTWPLNNILFLFSFSCLGLVFSISIVTHCSIGVGFKNDHRQESLILAVQYRRNLNLLKLCQIAKLMSAMQVIYISQSNHSRPHQPHAFYLLRIYCFLQSRTICYHMSQFVTVKTLPTTPESHPISHPFPTGEGSGPVVKRGFSPSPNKTLWVRTY